MHAQDRYHADILMLRANKGSTVAVLLVAFIILLLGPLLLLAHELTGVNLCKQQLKACLDSAALAAACEMTASNSTSASITQTSAMNKASWIFAQNSLLHVSLKDTGPYTFGTGSPRFMPERDQAQLYFQFIDPATWQPVFLGSSNGKIIKVFGAFGFVPAFARLLHLQWSPYTVTAMAESTLPMIDVVLCFDISSSMDDFTNVSLVNRYKLSATENGYALPKQMTVNGHRTIQGPLYYAIGATLPLGISANATYPMDLDVAGDNPQGKYFFNTPGHGKHTGQPAPQSLEAMNGYQNGHSYSDLAVNLDGTYNQSKGITINGFYFPKDTCPRHFGLGALVEAARGNLESIDVAKKAHVPYVQMGITPKKGYFKAHYQAALSVLPGWPAPSVDVPLRHPIGDALMAANQFFDVLNNNADAHFGLVTFGTYAGTKSFPTDAKQGPPYYIRNCSALFQSSENSNPKTIKPAPICDPYPPEPVQPINPAIYLNPRPGAAYSNFSSSAYSKPTTVNGALFSLDGSESTFGINTLSAFGGTNIQDGLDLALSMLLGQKPTDRKTTFDDRKALNLARPGAYRAIVLFTDGYPNGGGDYAGNAPSSQAEAEIANKAGIPIYTVGVAMNPSILLNQKEVLSDILGSDGIAAVSGHGAKYYQTCNSNEIGKAFHNVARQFVHLIE